MLLPEDAGKRTYTEKEFRREIETFAWNKAKQFWNREDIYDQVDLTETLEVIGLGSPNRLKKRPAARARARSERSLPETSYDSPFWNRFRQMGETMRQALGYSQPIPLEQLQGELRNILDSKRASKYDGWLLLQYPRKDWLEGKYAGVHIWSTALVWFPDVGSTYAINQVATFLNCHPALALAFLLCEFPVHRNVVTAVLDPMSPLALYVGRPEVPIWKIKHVYSLARRISLRLAGRQVADMPRPRGMSKRVTALVDFVAQHPGLSWEHRRREWNDLNPKWRYADATSMRVVYSRLKPRHIVKGSKTA